MPADLEEPRTLRRGGAGDQLLLALDPLGELVLGSVLHLRPRGHRLWRSRTDPVLEECLGGDDPHARLARGFHERRYPGLVEHTREVQAEHLRARRPLTRERFDIAVDVIDGGVPGPPARA